MKMNFLIILSILLYGSSCERLVDHVYSIKIQNNANDTILFFESYNYPDTLIIQNKPILNRVYPQDYNYLDSKKEWKEVLPNDTIIIFILSKDTVDKYNWDKIRINYNILKRYDLSIKDIEKQNWIVTYP